MAKQVEAWEADDGSLCRTEEAAECLNRELSRQGNLNEIGARIWDAECTEDAAKVLLLEWDLIVHMVDAYRTVKQPNTYCLEDYLDQGVWISEDGTKVKITEMADAHLKNAYRISNDGDRSGYWIYTVALRIELMSRGLLKEVNLEQS